MSALVSRARIGVVALVTAALTLSASPALAADQGSTGTAASSTATATPPPVITAGTPTIQGTAKVGYSLSAKPGTWTQSPTLAYQWLRSGVPISGARGTSYRLSPDDYNKLIAVRVTGTRSGFTTVTATSASKRIAAGTLTPSARMTGSAKVDKTVAVSLGSWGVSGVRFTYQWYANGKAIKNAASAKLKVTKALYGKRLAVKVTGTRAGYATASKTVTSPKVAAGASKAGSVAITGSMVVNSRAYAKIKGWRPVGMKYSYQWYANGKKIRGATKSSYKIAGSAAGKKLTVRVTAKARGYQTVARNSRASNPVNWYKLDKRCLVKGRVICADKTHRKVFQVQNGKILAAYDARFGRAGLRTRSGTFKIFYTSARQYSYLYNVYMPYAEFFSGGQGVHYSAEFATKGYGVGSHGCVNLRDYNGAKRIYKWARVGDRVVVYGRDH